ncbi:MAG: hypothetical protein VB078_00735, partial [Clostridiaceae bacterium]|nr:hypothetical protein [Clostridiaceae bacterium]
TAAPLPAQSGNPAFTAGTPATFGTQLTVDVGNLSTSSNLTYTWYRSVDASVGTDTQLTTGTTYTPVEADIGNYLIVVATSSDATGSGSVVTADAVAKAAAPAAPAGSIAGTYPPVAADSINLTGLGVSTTGLEAAVAIDGSAYEAYASLTVDASGNATISGLTSVTSATTVKIRVAGTNTTLAGTDKVITVSAAE